MALRRSGQSATAGGRKPVQKAGCLERGPQPGPAPVQQHALVARRELEHVANLLRAEPLDVAERHDQPLALGQLGQRHAELLARLERAEPALGVLPGPGRRRPALVATEAVLDRERAAVLVLEREAGERQRARLALGAGPRLVDRDAEEPGLDRRAALEAIDACDEGGP